MKYLPSLFILTVLAFSAFAVSMQKTDNTVASEPIILAPPASPEMAPVEIGETPMIPPVDTTPMIVTTPSTPADTAIVPFTIIDSGSISGAREDAAHLQVISDETAWKAFWSKHMTVVPAPTAPRIDFKTQMIIAVVDSDQPNSGYSLQLDRIEKHNNELWVYVTREQPGTACLNLGMLAQPFVIVTIPKMEMTGKLLLSTRMYDCE